MLEGRRKNVNRRYDRIRGSADLALSAGPGSFAALALAVVMLLLLLFPKLSLEGARNGLLLWYQTVLPTLLPFMICTNLVVSMNAMKLLTAPFAPVFKRVFRLSDPGCFVLLTGILCGYPMGAKNCSDLLEQGCLSLPEARCLYAVSNFPSPMFLAGYMMAKASQTAESQLTLPFWKIAAAVYLPVLPMFFLAAALYGYDGAIKIHDKADDKIQVRRQDRERGAQDRSPYQASPSLPLDEALSSSISVMVRIGGYLMLFSILARFIGIIFPAGSFLTCLLVSAAEMTTGMEAVSQRVWGFPGVLLIVGAGTFGGLSGAFQVRSVTKNAGCSIRHYILWKTMHCLLACLFLTCAALL